MPLSQELGMRYQNVEPLPPYSMGVDRYAAMELKPCI